MASFDRKWEAIGFTIEDTSFLEQEIMKNPHIGDVIEGTGGLRKMRVAIDKGKSGGARVCYIDIAVDEQVYMIACYEKKEKSNLTRAEKNSIKRIINTLITR